MKSQIFLSLLVIMPMSLISSDIKWNVFSQFSDESYTGFYYYSDQTPEISFSFHQQGEGKISITADGPVNLGSSRALWVHTYVDTVLTESYFSDAEVVLDAWYTQNSILPGETIDLSNGDSFYLALAGSYPTYFWNPETNEEHWIDKDYTAWLYIEVEDGTLDLRKSALYEGFGLIVGGGLATPEPSCSMLVLLGVAALSLRRRGRHKGIKPQHKS